MQGEVLWHWLGGAPGRWAARGVTLLLALLLFYQLARLVWVLLPPPELPPPEPAEVEPAAAVAPTPSGADGRRIAGWHLFGKAEATAVARPAPIEAPETRLRLTLRGLIASDDPDQARAIIAQAGGEERSYRVGDEITSGVTLSEIYPDRVILERNGRYETLRLPRERVASPARQASLPGSAAGGEILARYRDQVLQNPRSLIELVRPVPHRENNRFVGFRLYPGSKPALFRQLGLRPGDLVTAVNGIALDSPARGMELLNDLRTSESLAVTIRRGSEQIELDFNLT